MCTFKNLEEIWKSWKNFLKTSDNPVYNTVLIKRLFHYKFFYDILSL